ncbi:hypothetical protein OEA41_006382 [Lepraria neglecta]|uniref:Uncharacterized protein n=1 Tax=Lepraria neglecta TaxID=209136 RepID=A0AAE0DN02_9LECA|nr:hypothetical protein OEA41_006382 [Lepraria neglecta]
MEHLLTVQFYYQSSSFFLATMLSSVIVEQLPLSELNSAVALHLLCPACERVCQAAPILHASPDDESSADVDEATDEEEITAGESVVAKADTVAEKEGTATDETAGVEEDIDDSVGGARLSPVQPIV